MTSIDTAAPITREMAQPCVSAGELPEEQTQLSTPRGTKLGENKQHSTFRNLRHLCHENQTFMASYIGAKSHYSCFTVPACS